MATVDGYTKAKVDELIGAVVTSIAIGTSTARPTGADLFEGLGLYETDTKRFYIYDGAAWQYRGGIWICTSSTRPLAPFAGLMIFETDTKFLYIYTGSAWLYCGGKIICTSSTRPAAPFEGLEIFETDTDRIGIYDGTGWLHWDLNWVTYSPTFTNLNVGTTGTSTFQRKVEGRLCKVRGQFTLGGTGVSVGAVTFTLPFAMVDTLGIINKGYWWPATYHDTGASFYDGRIGLTSTTVAALGRVDTGATSATTGAIGSTSPFTWVAGDSVVIPGFEITLNSPYAA